MNDMQVDLNNNMVFHRGLSSKLSQVIPNRGLGFEAMVMKDFGI
jgi:hypothetical protein